MLTTACTRVWQCFSPETSSMIFNYYSMILARCVELWRRSAGSCMELHMCAHTRKHTHARMRTHTCVHTHTHARMHAHMRTHAHTYARTHVHTHTHTHTHTHARTHARTHVCRHTQSCLCVSARSGFANFSSVACDAFPHLSFIWLAIILLFYFCRCQRVSRALNLQTLSFLFCFQQCV